MSSLKISVQLAICIFLLSSPKISLSLPLGTFNLVSPIPSRIAYSQSSNQPLQPGTRAIHSSNLYLRATPPDLQLEITNAAVFQPGVDAAKALSNFWAGLLYTEQTMPQFSTDSIRWTQGQLDLIVEVLESSAQVSTFIEWRDTVALALLMHEIALRGDMLLFSGFLRSSEKTYRVNFNLREPITLKDTPISLRSVRAYQYDEL